MRASGPGTGEMLTPNIRLISPLGEGGMGFVWLAHHGVLGRSVAVKFLRDQIAHEPSAQERFRREAEVVASLASPHIVDVLESGRSSHDVPYIVMELLDGETLQDRVEARGFLTLEELTPILRQMCLGLGAAHAAGVVHRDVKPDNIFLVAKHEGDPEPRETVKILDFGIARQLDDAVGRVTTTGNVVGTPLFMAPEQMSGMAVLPASDVWSVAVVVYHCLTGQLPYDGPNLASLALAIDRERPRPVTAFSSALPKAVDDWLGRALAPRHEDRYANALELLEAFERHVIAGAPMPAHDGGAAWDDGGPGPEIVLKGRFPSPKRRSIRVTATTAANPRVQAAKPRRNAKIVLGFAASALLVCLGATLAQARLEREQVELDSMTRTSTLPDPALALPEPFLRAPVLTVSEPAPPAPALDEAARTIQPVRVSTSTPASAIPVVRRPPVARRNLGF